MKKIIFLGLMVLLSLSACSTDFLNSDSPEAPPAEEIDIEATIDSAASTKAVQTVNALEALATPTISAALEIEETATATETSTQTETATAEATETPETVTETPDGTLPAETATQTPEGTLTSTETPDGTPATATTGTQEVTATSIYPSPTSPISAGYVPDYIPRFKVKVRNNTKVRVYISLQGVTVGGYTPVVEYDLAPWQKTKMTVPEGRYAIIVYVGKEPMIEYIGVHSSNTVEITIYKDYLKVEK